MTERLDEMAAYNGAIGGTHHTYRAQFESPSNRKRKAARQRQAEAKKTLFTHPSVSHGAAISLLGGCNVASNGRSETSGCGKLDCAEMSPAGWY